MAWLLAHLEQPAAHVSREPDGTIAGLTFRSREERDQAVAKLASSDGRVWIGGQGYELPGRAQRAPDRGAGIESHASALSESASTCSGSFCISADSWNTHLTLFGGVLYHDVGAETVQVSGGLQKQAYRPISWTAYCALGGRIPCTYHQCNAGDPPPYNTRTGWWCDAGWNDLAVNVDFLATINGTPQVIHSEGTSQANVTWAGVDEYTFGRLMYDCVLGACVVDGVCSHHFAESNGGAVQTSTAAGSGQGVCF
jgi:hypothetical protein